MKSETQGCLPRGSTEMSPASVPDDCSCRSGQFCIGPRDGTTASLATVRRATFATSPRYRPVLDGDVLVRKTNFTPETLCCGLWQMACRRDPEGSKTALGLMSVVPTILSVAKKRTRAAAMCFLPHFQHNALCRNSASCRVLLLLPWRINRSRSDMAALRRSRRARVG